MKIVELPLVENLPKMKALLDEHWQEVGSHKGTRDLNINEDAYREFESLGRLMSLFCIDDTGDMVGYSVNIMADDYHSMGTLIAKNDALFVASKHRKRGLGIRLIRKTEEEAKARGAQIVCWHAKDGSQLQKVLTRMKYGVLDVIYSKVLK